MYIASAFAVDPVAATAALTEKVDALAAAEQTALVERFLQRVFGGGYYTADFTPENLPLDSLKRIVDIAFRTIRVKDDRERQAAACTRRTNVIMRSRHEMLPSVNSSGHPAEPRLMRF